MFIGNVDLAATQKIKKRQHRETAREESKAKKRRLLPSTSTITKKRFII